MNVATKEICNTLILNIDSPAESSILCLSTLIRDCEKIYLTDDKSMSINYGINF